MECEKIDIKLLELEKQKNVEQKHCFIELRTNSLIYEHSFVAEEPEDYDHPELKWETVNNFLRLTIYKPAITALEFCWMDGSKHWKVLMAAKGINGDVRVYFKKKSEAQIFHDKIEKWWLGENK
jgi:hypothetical protein